jgi:hypothetical protein
MMTSYGEYLVMMERYASLLMGKHHRDQQPNNKRRRLSSRATGDRVKRLLCAYPRRPKSRRAKRRATCLLQLTSSGRKHVVFSRNKRTNPPLCILLAGCEQAHSIHTSSR